MSCPFYSMLPFVSSIDAILFPNARSFVKIIVLFRESPHSASAKPIATIATPAPAALLATAAPEKVACEKLLSVVALALCVSLGLAVGIAELLPEDTAELIYVRTDAELIATLCSDMTEAMPEADVATLGMPVMMPAEFVMVV